MNDPDARALLEKVHGWLYDKEPLLKDNARTALLDNMLTEHIAKIKRKEQNRTWARDIILYAGVLSLVVSVSPKLWQLILGAFQ